MKFELEKAYHYIHNNPSFAIGDVWADILIKEIINNELWVFVLRVSKNAPQFWKDCMRTQRRTLWAYIDTKAFDYSRYTLIDYVDYDTRNIYDSLEEMLYEC